MESKLLFNNHFSHISDYLSCSNNITYIISPFINTTTLTKLLSGVVHNDVMILTSWRKEHLMSGVSSLDIYPLCAEKNWTLYINDRVHAKIYSDGLRSGYVGSPNCTDSGLMDLRHSNIECLTFVQDFSHVDRSEINKIFLSSMLVDDKVFSSYSKWMKNKKIVKPESYSEEVYTDTRLFTSQFPATSSPLHLWNILGSPLKFDEDSQRRAEHDVGLFRINWANRNYDEYIRRLREAFFSNPFVIKFEETIQDRIFFGEASEWVQNYCDDDPTPYRKEVKNLVEYLFTWFVTLDDEKF